MAESTKDQCDHSTGRFIYIYIYYTARGREVHLIFYATNKIIYSTIEYHTFTLSALYFCLINIFKCWTHKKHDLFSLANMFVSVDSTRTLVSTIDVLDNSCTQLM